MNIRSHLDDEIDPLMHKVPTMLIQPYVENSICHGLMPKEGKGFVNIDLKLKEDYILCTIEDNGIGREAAKERNQKREGNHNSLGTQITKSRLDLVNELYGTSLQTIYTDLKNENGEPAGTRGGNSYSINFMSRKLKTIIVDDEQDAVDFISSIIGEYCASLEVVGKANNVIQGVAAINDKKPDLVFLDVEMPNGIGI